VKALLVAGADVHADGEAALRLAAGNGHTDTVKVLLEAGADVHAKEDWAVRWAAKNGHTDTVRLLNEWMAREAKKPAEGPETT
jgi:ankyrin repeat protein